MTRRILVDQVILIHQDQVGAGPLIHPDKIENAVASPFQDVFGREVYPSLPAKAAKLADGISRAQAFQDGNKRLAWHATLALLALNQYDVVAPQAEAAEFILGLDGQAATLQAGALWINHRMKRVDTRVETRRHDANQMLRDFGIPEP